MEQPEPDRHHRVQRRPLCALAVALGCVAVGVAGGQTASRYVHGSRVALRSAPSPAAPVVAYLTTNTAVLRG